MKRLGISIYPEKSNKEELFSYLETAADFGARRIFSCLLSVDSDRETIKREFLEINTYAHELGFEVIVDVAPRIFDALGISYKDLTFFKEIGADGVRLDMGFTGLEESLMTYNPQGLAIEINMSNDTHTLDTIMDYRPQKDRLYGCHNFYPHAYTGLDLEFFKKTTERFVKHGLRTAAFVTSQNSNTFGSWPVTQGLPTLEMHRSLPLDVQIKHLIALDTIDDIIISNCYPSQDEVEALKCLNMSMPSFKVNVYEGISKVEEKILFNELHFSRGDHNENLIRSTQSRVKYKGHNFEVWHTPKTITRGDVLIESSLYGHYAGEVQIALTDMENSGMTNVVGRIAEDELFILDAIEPWQKFRFEKGKTVCIS